MRGATGPSENLSSGPDLGRPRWEERRTLAPLSIRYFTVGTDARMRVSSEMVFPSRGTFRSQRTRTFLPLRSASVRSPTDFLAISTGDDRVTRDPAMRENAAPLYAAAPERKSTRRDGIFVGRIRDAPQMRIAAGPTREGTSKKS